MVDMVVHRHAMKATVARLARLLMRQPAVEGAGGQSPATAAA